jgi:PAS domain S-box-containing protein
MQKTVELLSVLYELSLSNLKHLKPEDTAREFVRKFLARKSLQYGAVWRIVYYDEHLIHFNKMYAMPSLHDHVTVDFARFSNLFKTSNFAILDKSIINENTQTGRFAYFKLSDFGLLELHDAGKEDNEFNKDAFYPYLDVIAQLGISLESGFSYQALQQEVKQRIEAEKSLQTNEEKYRRIIDNIKLGLLEVDNDELIQHANKPFLDLTGYSLNEIIGQKASDLFVDDDLKEIISEQNKNRIKGQSSSYEIQIKSKKGESKWLIISGAPNFNNKNEIIGSIGIHMDISEQKKLREDNEFKDTHLKKLFEKSLDALVSINQHGEIFDWSPKAEEIFGYTTAEILGKKLSETIIPHQHRDGHTLGMKNYLKTGNGPVLNSRIEITALRKSGEEFPIELTIFPLVFQDQHYFTAFIRDITEIKKSKENMLKALERQKELTNMKSQFISMTSHELRTPLTTIKNNTELANYQLENSPELNREKLSKNILRIDQNVDRLNSLINNILMIGQLDSQKVPFNPESTDICNYIQQKILPDFQVRNETIICTKNGVEYPMKLDKRLFSHIIINLLENAIKYSAGKDSPELIIDFQEDQLEIKVRDHGIGIPEKDQLRLFDTFFRASNVGNIQGTGLGLSIVKEFVTIHGGKINVDSELDNGTTFSIFFPRH